jgi:hypothetical protein
MFRVLCNDVADSVSQDNARSQPPKAQSGAPKSDRRVILAEVLEMAELEPGAGPGGHKPNDATADVQPQKVAVRVEDIALCLHVNVHQADAANDVGPQ